MTLRINAYNIFCDTCYLTNKNMIRKVSLREKDIIENKENAQIFRTEQMGWCINDEGIRIRNRFAETMDARSFNWELNSVINITWIKALLSELWMGEDDIDKAIRREFPEDGFSLLIETRK